MIRRLELAVPDEGTLAALLDDSRPIGLTAGKSDFAILRETFFDTADGALRERRMRLRLRMLATGRQMVELRTVTAVNLQGIVEESVMEAPIIGSGLYATLAGGTELAMRVRDAVDPVALRPELALDIDREIRELKAGWFGKALHRMRVDRIIAHVDGTGGVFRQISIEEISRGKVTLEALAERLARDYGVSHDGLDTVDRIRPNLVGTPDARTEMPHDVRVAILLLRAGSVALVPGDDGLMLPTARGSGEDLAGEYLSELVVSEEDEPELELLGFAPSQMGESDLEVWLHEDAPGAEDDGADFLWMPLVELLERAGAPRLRDPGLISALLLLVRSEIGLRLLREAPGPRDAPARIPVTPHPAGVELGRHDEDFLDSELSIMDFNQRVLELAEDPDIPLLERFRFLSIFSSNMDEFFVVRVGRLKAQAQMALEADDATLAAAELLDVVSIRVRSLMARQYRCLTQNLLPGLRDHGIRIRRWDELEPEEQSALTKRFEDEVFPLLTPTALSASPGQPFPRLTSLGLSLVVMLKDIDNGGRPHLGHVPMPRRLSRLMAIPGSQDLVTVEAVVEANAASLFPGYRFLEAHAFRVSRLGDVSIDEEVSESLISAVADEVESRPFKPVVRLEVQRTMPREVRALLLRELRTEKGTDSPLLTRADVYEVDGPIDLRDLNELADLPLPDDQFEPFRGRPLFDPADSLFDYLSENGDLLVHHPFETFEHSVGHFLREAARDPNVASIKLTLYRTGSDSPVMDALMGALANGKEVSVFVELKARFDEESNIGWTHRLTEAGAHVVTGLVGLKTHAKTALVVRREGDKSRRYVHIGTGNYNAATARFYTDLGLMSADPDLAADLNDFFNELTGSSGAPVKDFRRLWVAPNSLGQNIVASIERETEHARAGRPARIQAKMNGLTDKRTIRALYEASQAGVQVDLIVRAICTLRPGLPGLSENIEVTSILGRFLEHARIYYFENAGQGIYLIGSADWRKRNLRRRVEVVTPVDDPAARDRLQGILDYELADPRAWRLRPDGAYERRGETGPSAQETFQAMSKDPPAAP